ncbi:MAG: histidinol-phosphate transaminase [Deltaproteobacteria bacterium]|nr:histidinol-phosphate transaminase [Deltaproteobacteria bacterium]
MLPLVNDAYEHLDPYIPGKPVAETERELGISGVVKLASNENPLGPSPKAVAAIRAALAQLHDYPDGSAFYLKERLAKVHGVPPAQIVVGNGTNEIIELVVRTCMRPGENTVCATPAFIVYRLAPQAAGHEIRQVPLKAMRYDLAAMAARANDKTKLVIIGNPNNPTGTYVTRQELEAFLAAIPAHVLVVMDEAYFEYVGAADYPNGLDYLKTRERLLVLRTFSKCYGLAGLRIGYGIGAPKLIDYLNRGRQPFNTNSLAQAGALAALDDAEHVARCVALNRKEMARLVPELRKRGLGVTDSVANFVLVDFGRDVREIFEKLLRQGVIVRPMVNYGLPTSARITIGTPEQNDRLMAALGRVL